LRDTADGIIGLPLPSKNRIVQNIIRDYLPTAIATLIEPMWILINRLLCMLQPLEELQGSHSRACKSISLNYSSLPPQLTILKAARAGHLLLASVCAMALLANLLATALAGLLFQDTLPVSKPALFSPPYEAKFVSINGSAGPLVDRSPAMSQIEYSGAYQGSTGEAHFLASESNYTRNTSLPAWIDSDAMYLPFLYSEAVAPNSTRQYEAQTQFFSAKASCKPLEFGVDYQLRLWMHSSAKVFSIKVRDEEGKETTCYSNLTSSTTYMGIYLGAAGQKPSSQACRTGHNAAELLTTLGASFNATQHQQDTCMSTVVVGWMRKFQGGDCTEYYVPYPNGTMRAFNVPPSYWEDAHPNNTFLLSCQPKLTIGNATVLVDSAGILQQKAVHLSPRPDQSTQAQDPYFSTGVANFLAQSNRFIFRSLIPIGHNNSFAGEPLHYFINRAVGTTQLTDPVAPLPTWEDVEAPLNEAYTRLFAIWLGVNKDLLFERADNASSELLGSIITMEERILFRTPMFIISEAILALYILVAVILYFRRPVRYLPRMPMSIAAVISLFAASAAVRDLRGTEEYTAEEREQCLNDLDARYGYGSYVGGDGSVHVGIEKAPFVTAMETTRFEGSRVDKEIRRSEGKGEKERADVRYAAVEGTERPSSGVSDV
jgi:hypothetical protein